MRMSCCDSSRAQVWDEGSYSLVHWEVTVHLMKAGSLEELGQGKLRAPRHYCLRSPSSSSFSFLFTALPSILTNIPLATLNPITTQLQQEHHQHRKDA